MEIFDIREWKQRQLLKEGFDVDMLIMGLNSSELDAILDFYGRDKSLKGNIAELSKWLTSPGGKKVIPIIKKNPNMFR